MSTIPHIHVFLRLCLSLSICLSVCLCVCECVLYVLTYKSNPPFPKNKQKQYQTTC